MTPAEAAAFRLGLEAAAKVAERGRLVPDCYDHGRSTVVVDMAADEIAGAIRALPVPAAVEVTDAEATRVHSAFVEALCSINSPTLGDAIASMKVAIRAARGQP